MHLVGLICEITQGCTVNKTLKKHTHKIRLQFLCAFAKSRKAPVKSVISVHLSVRPHVTV